MKFKELTLGQKQQLFQDYIKDFDLVVMNNDLNIKGHYVDNNIRATFAMFCAISDDKEVVEVDL